MDKTHGQQKIIQVLVILVVLFLQFPFFVSHEFFVMTVMTVMQEETKYLIGMIYAFFEYALPGTGYAHNSEHSTKIKHLVEFIHHN